jgi:Holliday junction resolvase RusA-like endonuclease
VTITVRGLPGPQGSKRHVGKGIMIESSKKVKPWREAVKWAVLEQCARPEGLFQIAGPIVMEVTFTLRKPKGARRNAKPDKYPDLSKVVRATEDALTDVGVWEDDARVVECLSRKVFPGEHKDALPAPGAVIHIRAHEAYSEIRNMGDAA